ncbi:type II secretion system protein D precursor [bacterium BMS3Bbin09]|nr:type II secretion system protein D precursor [bacterium BMS3Bbin09]
MNIKKLFIIISLFIFSFPLFTQPSFADNMAEETISFNFVDVEIQSVIKFISEITGNNFLYDERIKGKITIITPTKLSVDESFTLFTSVLSLKGFTIIPAGHKTYKIIPRSLAKQEGQISTARTPLNESYITKLITTKHVKAKDTINFLRPIVSRDGHISAFGSGNLLLIADSALNIEKIMSILKIIDKPETLKNAAKEEINVYFLENADATSLAQVLQGIIKNLNTSLKPAGKGKNQALPVLSVTPDKTTNSLIIVSTPSAYENIIRVIKTLDKRRKQVYVEAMIVEASINKLKELGSKWRVAASHENSPVAVGGFGNISSSAIQSIVTGLTGTSVGGMGNFMNIPVTSVNSNGTFSSQTLTAPGFAALFSLNEFEGAINVLSTPQILTSDNEEAEIIVGENVPFIAQRERDLTTTNTVLSSIKRTDVGITLRITPQITEGNYVKLNIFQEISAVKAASDTILTTVGPSTTKRSTRTSVSVLDGSTVVIGGLIQEREEDGITKTPILGDIPVLGWLFKYKSKTKTKINLLVFLSPHIVNDAPKLAKITEEKQRKFNKNEKFYRKNELLVRFNSDIMEDTAASIISEKEAAIITYFKEINTYRIKLKTGQEVEDAVKEFTSLPEVLYAEPNYKFKTQSDPLNNNTDGN